MIYIVKCNIANIYLNLYSNTLKVFFSLFSVCQDMDYIIGYKYFHDCVLQVYYYDDKDRALDLTLTYSFLCETLPTITDFAARRLCNEFSGDAKFPRYIGSNCDISCENGYASEEDGELCVCFEGFWGDSCQQKCPTSADGPCSGFGGCGQTTGSCSCPQNRDGDDCSSCASGWYGEGCVVTVTDVSAGTTSLVMASHSGAMFTDDGISYIFSGVGEYHLLSFPPNAVIQGRFVKCYDEMYCLANIGLRLGNNGPGFATITIEPPYPGQIFPNVLVNGEPNMVTEELYLTGVKISRISALEVVIDIAFDDSSNIKVFVRSIHGYLQFSAEMSLSLRGHGSGLLSGSGSDVTGTKLEYIQNIKGFGNTILDLCSINNVQDLTGSYSGTISLGSLSPVKQTGSGVSDVSNDQLVQMANYWKVDSCDSVFEYSDSRSDNHLMGGSAIYLDGSSVFTLTFDSLGENITLEFYVNADTNGTIFSYAAERTFSMYIEGTLKFSHGTQETDTTLIVDHHTWNKIAFTYQGNTGETNVYIFSSTREIHRRRISLETMLFTEKCTIALGMWQPPNDGASHAVLPPLVGTIDNFRLWNVMVSVDMITKLHDLSGSLDAAIIASSWDFNRDLGQREIRARTKPRKLLTSANPWHTIVPVPSDIPDPVVIHPATVHVEFVDNSQWVSASAQCKEEIELLMKNCTGLDEATAAFYEMACIRDIKSESHLNAGIRSIVLLADICKATSVPDWPAKGICNKVFSRQGSSCSSECVFGYLDTEEKCTCFAGFSGSNCENSCPATEGSVCSNHGTCADTGSCDCAYNWKGDAACSTCTPGYYGQDCSLLYVQPPAGNKVGLVTASGNYLTFDGIFFSMVNQAGIFDLIVTARIKVAVHQLICDTVSCVDTLLITYGGEDIEIVAPGTRNHPIVYRNRVMMNIDENEVTVTSDITIGQRSDEEVFVQIVDSVQGETLTVNVQASLHRISVAINSGETLCTTNVGLFGSCDGDRSNDLLGLTEEQTAFERSEALAENYQTNSSDISVTPQSTLTNSQASFSLKLQGNIAETHALVYDIEQSDDGDFTLSLMVKSENHGGVILSYGKDEVFSLKNDEHFSMSCGESHIVPKTTNIVNEWSQIMIAYEGNSNTFHFYHFRESKVTYEILPAPCSGIFSKGGKLTLGMDSVIPNGQAVNIQGSFHGYVDELAIWRVKLSHDQIFQVWNLNIGVDRFASELAYLYKFREGKGCIAHDLISGNDLYFSCGDTTAWVPSDNDISSVISVVGTVTHVTEDTSKDGSQPQLDWGSVPTDRFGSGIIPGYGVQGGGTSLGDTDSSGLGISFGDLKEYDINDRPTPKVFGRTLDQLADNVYTAVTESSCPLDDTLVEALTHIGMSSGTSMQDEDLLLSELASLIMLSETAGDDSAADATLNLLCSDPLIMDPTCDTYFQKCQFGSWDEVYLQCSCRDGHYGADRCDQNCPGGVDNPCNGRGICLVNGQCECQGHWNGTACDTCEDGFTGTDCSVLHATLQMEAKKDVSVINSDGSILTSDMTSFNFGDMAEEGLYNLFDVESENLTVYGNMVNCSTGTCLESVVFVKNGKTIFIDTNSQKEDHVTVWTDPTTPEDVYASTTLEDIGLKITRLPGSQIQVTSTTANSTFTSVLTFVEDIMVPSFTLDKNTTSGGLLGSCDTITAIRTARCEEIDPCNETLNVEGLGCALDLSSDSVALYIDSNKNKTSPELLKAMEEFKKNSEIVNDNKEDLGVMSTQTEENLALHINGNGLTTGKMNYVLPEPVFTCQMQINPQQYGGVVMSYGPPVLNAETRNVSSPVTDEQGNVIYTGEETALFELELTSDGLNVVYNGHTTATGLQLPLKENSQIDVEFNYETNDFEIYVTSTTTHESAVAIVRLDDNAFQPGGELTIGQTVPGTDSTIEGGLNAFVDEFRIFNHGTTKDDVSYFTAVDTSVTTPGLAFSWSFDNGLTDEVAGVSLSPTTASDNPEFQSSPVILSFIEDYSEKDTPRSPRPLTVEEALTNGGEYIVQDPLNPLPEELLPRHEVIEAEKSRFAEDTCNSAFGNEELMAKCGDIGEVLTGIYKDMCIEQVTVTGNIQSGLTALSTYSDLCHQLFEPEDSPLVTLICNSDLGLEVPGTDCEVECSYGEVESDTCQCDDSHYGEDCSLACPVTSFGVCNGFGSCNESSGQCPCPGKTSGSSLSLKSFLSGSDGDSVRSVASDETQGCSNCSQGWYGVDCSVGVLSLANASVSQTNGVCILAGTALTTFDGVMVDINSLGAFGVMKAESNKGDVTEIQGLYAPCLGKLGCRKLTEVAFKQGTTVISVFIDNGETNARVYESDREILIEYPYNMDHPTNAKIQLDWDDRHVTRLLGDDGIKYTLASLGDEIIFTANIPKHYNGTLSQMCGDNDGEALDDTNFGRMLPNGTYVPVSQEYLENRILTSTYLAEAHKTFYSVSPEESFLKTGDNYTLEATGAGFMLKIDGGSVECTSIDAGPFEEFTLTGNTNLKYE